MTAECEAVLAAWIEHWDRVAAVLHIDWPGPPYRPGDLENALCLYQEQVRAPRC